eukprot:scaffold31486_cov75-Phaeocystis_antarctica.AAC.3
MQHLAYALYKPVASPFSHEAAKLLHRALHHRRTDHGADQRVRAICAQRGNRLRLALAGGRSDVDFHVDCTLQVGPRRGNKVGD